MLDLLTRSQDTEFDRREPNRLGNLHVIYVHVTVHLVKTYGTAASNNNEVPAEPHLPFLTQLSSTSLLSLTISSDHLLVASARIFVCLHPSSTAPLMRM